MSARPDSVSTRNSPRRAGGPSATAAPGNHSTGMITAADAAAATTRRRRMTRMGLDMGAPLGGDGGLQADSASPPVPRCAVGVPRALPAVAGQRGPGALERQDLIINYFKCTSGCGDHEASAA